MCPLLGVGVGMGQHYKPSVVGGSTSKYKLGKGVAEEMTDLPKNCPAPPPPHSQLIDNDWPLRFDRIQMHVGNLRYLLQCFNIANNFKNDKTVILTHLAYIANGKKSCSHWADLRDANCRRFMTSSFPSSLFPWR